ncbi:MAG: hypothetical protein V2G48_08020 [bacterium JZ-2024 1]
MAVMVLCGGIWMAQQGWAFSGPSEKPADTSSRQVEGFYLGCRWIASPKDIPVPQEKIKEWENLLDRVKMTEKGRREFMIQLWTLTYQSEQFRKGKKKAQRRISQKRGNGITPGAVNPAPSGFAELSSTSAEKLCCGQIIGDKKPDQCDNVSKCCPMPPPDAECSCKEVPYVESELVDLVDSGESVSGDYAAKCGCDTINCTCNVKWEEWKCKPVQKSYKDCLAGVEIQEINFWNFTKTKRFKCDDLKCSHGEGAEAYPVCPYNSLHCPNPWLGCAQPCCSQEECQSRSFCNCLPDVKWDDTCKPVVAWGCYFVPELCQTKFKVGRPAVSAGCYPVSCGP